MKFENVMDKKSVVVLRIHFLTCVCDYVEQKDEGIDFGVLIESYLIFSISVWNTSEDITLLAK